MQLEKVDIMSCFSRELVPRDVQVRALTWLEQNYDNFDVFIVNGPVACGKSLIVTTYSAWLEKNLMGRSSVLTPTRMLQDQYGGEFPWMALLKGLDNYQCNVKPGKTCAAYKVMNGKVCDPAGCNFIHAYATTKASSTALLNLSIYHACKMHRPHVIIDEAHNAVNWLSQQFERNLWQCETKYPVGLEPKAAPVAAWLGELLKMLIEQQAEARMLLNERLTDQLEKDIRSVGAVKTALDLYPEDMLLVKKREWYQGSVCPELKNSEQEAIVVKPLRVNRLGSIYLWPESEVKKIVLLSATIGPEIAAKLGLEGKRVGYLELDSCIPAENRPFIYWPVADMSYKNRAKSIPVVAEAIRRIVDKHPDQNGIAHCTYEVAKELKKLLDGDDRFLFHTKYNKDETYGKFLRAKGKVLIASGMTEGIDLIGDRATFQIMTMVVWPSLQDDVCKWRFHNERAEYLRETALGIQQAYGRVCRSPTDNGSTFMLDLQFTNLHNQCLQRGVKWPKWFTDAIKWPKKVV